MYLFLSAVSVALIVSSSSVACAAGITSPKQVVEKLYAPYLADPHAEEIAEVAALDLIRPYASKALKHAIHRNKVCERQEQGICAIDFDVIVNGQDWDLSGFALAEDESTETALPIIRASFLNTGTKSEVDYYFISEDGAWKIDEIETRHIQKKGRQSAVFKLKEALSQQPL